MHPFAFARPAVTNDSSPLAAWLRELFAVRIHDDVKSILTSCALALLGVLLLRATYSLIKTNWPESYTSVETRAEEHIRVNPIRTYILFRGGPVFIIALFISVSIERAGGIVWLGYWLMIIVYLICTTGKAIYDMIQKESRHPNWTMMSIYHVISIVVVLFVGTLAVLLRSLFASWIPGQQDLLIAIWAGIFATLLGAAAHHILKPTRVESHGVVDVLRKDVGETAWDYLTKSTPNQPYLQDLARAILLAECQQRPKWFRRLERLGGKIWGKGTYGVAQAAADSPITDEQSIDILISHLRALPVYSATFNGPYSDEFSKLCRSWNDDPAHARRIGEFYEILQSRREASES